ncbi:MAG: AsmA-like C-terminal region-containing protein [bacterium]
MKRSRNFFLLFVVFSLFIYVSFNVLLNFSPLRQQIVKRIERGPFDRAEISFLYVNWQLNPTVRSLTVTKESPADKPTVTIDVSDIELVIAWSNLINGNVWGLDNHISRVNVDSVRMISNIDVGGFSERSDRKAGGGKTLAKHFPKIPIEIDTWRILLERNGRRLFNFTGSKAKFHSVNHPFETVINRIEGKRVEVRARASSLEPLSLDFNINSLSLPDSIWTFQGDQWRGTGSFSTEGENRLKLSLTGTPAGVGDRQLSPVEIKSSLKYSAGDLEFEKFMVQSDYLDMGLSGRMNLPGDSVSIRGQYTLKMEEEINKLFPDRINTSFNLSSKDPLEGTLSIDGSLADYQVKGDFSVPETTVTLKTPRSNRTFVFKHTQGSLSGKSITIDTGTLSEGNGTLQVDSGSLRLRKGTVRSRFSGRITELAPTSTDTQIPVLGKVLGSLKSTNIPVETSFAFSRSAFTGDVILEDGIIEAENGNIRKIKMLLSASSQPESRDIIRGNFIDPGGNQWRFRGTVPGPVSFRSNLESIDYVTDNLGRYQPAFLSDFSLRNLDVSGNISDLRDIQSQYEVVFDLSNASLLSGVTSPSTSPLKGTITVNSDTVYFDRVQIGAEKDRLIAMNGRLTHTQNWASGRWDLGIRVQNLNPNRYLNLGDHLRMNLTSDLSLTGKLHDPKLAGPLRDSVVEFRDWSAKKISGDVTVKSNRLSLENISGRMNQGDLSGSFDYSFGDTTVVTMGLNEFSLPGIFPDASWMAKKSHGTMNLSVTLRGQSTDPESYDGYLAGSGRNVILDNFPKIEDIQQVARPSVFEKRLRVKQFKFKFPVESGEIQISDFLLTTGQIDLNTSGTARLNGTLGLDMTLTLRGRSLKRYLQDVLGNLYRQVGLRSGDKQLKIPFRIKGSVYSPVLDINRKKVSDDFRKNLMRDLFSEPIGKPLNELLEEVFFLE